MPLILQIDVNAYLTLNQIIFVLISLYLLSCILARMHRRTTERPDAVMFTLLLILAAERICLQMDGRNDDISRTILLASNMVRYVLSMTPLSLLFLYTDRILKMNYFHHKMRIRLIFLMNIIPVLFLLVNNETGWVFFVSIENRTIAGIGEEVLLLMNGISCLIYLLNYWRRRRTVWKRELSMVHLFVPILLIGSILRTDVHGFRLSWSLLSLAFMITISQNERKASNEDYMCNMLNRRGMKKEWASLASRKSYSLTCIDIDHMKRINDQYGLTKGDAAITTTARAIRQSLPPGSSICRHLPDVFLVLIRSDDPQKVKRMLERLNDRLRESAVSGDLPCRVTVSAATIYRDGSCKPAYQHEVDAVVLELRRTRMRMRLAAAYEEKMDVYDITNNYHKTNNYFSLLKGNLAPDGAVVRHSCKRSDNIGEFAKSRLRVCTYDSEEAATSALLNLRVQSGAAVVMQCEGLKRAGMPEVFYDVVFEFDSRTHERSSGDAVALITSGQYKDTMNGPHESGSSRSEFDCTPIMLLEDGDLIEIDIGAGRINVVGIADELRMAQDVSDVFALRHARWQTKIPASNTCGSKEIIEQAASHGSFHPGMVVGGVADGEDAT